MDTDAAEDFSIHVAKDNAAGMGPLHRCAPPTEDSRLNLLFTRNDLNVAVSASARSAALGPDEITYLALCNLGTQGKKFCWASTASICVLGLSQATGKEVG